MSANRDELLATLEEIYRRGSVWGEPRRAADGTVRVPDCGGVTWIALAVLPDDLDDAGFPARIRDLADTRMPGDGRRCPLELLPAEECRAELGALLHELRLDERVGVYSLAA